MRLSPEEIANWCQRSLPHDSRAFEFLVEQYKGRVFSTAYRLMGNRHEAEDQAQEVFLKVYRGIRKLNEPATLTSWIHRITINTCLDALEKQQRRTATAEILPAEVEDAGPEYVDTRNPDPAEALERRDLRRCLDRAVVRLSSDMRSVIILRDVEGLSYEEIAGVLEIRLSAVKMRIHRARLSVQKLMELVCPGLWKPRAA